MKHIEKHTFALNYDMDLLNEYGYSNLIKEVIEFKKAWPTSEVYTGYGVVTITYTGAGSFLKAEAAACQFQKAIQRHEWWREV